MIYILEFEERLAHARFYVGYTENERTLPRRIEHHRNGTGARITAAASERGIGFEVVAIIPDGSRTLERRIKNRKSTARVIEQIARTGHVYGHAARMIKR